MIAEINDHLPELPGHQADRTMPMDACQFFDDCQRCAARSKPKAGDCCVFCSYGSVPCPPMQAARANEAAAWLRLGPAWRRLAGERAHQHDCVVAPERRNGRHADSARARSRGCMGRRARVDGAACILNSRRCGRTRCRYTGPYYLAMIVPVMLAGTGIVPLSLYAWIALGAVALGGSALIWFVTERAWADFCPSNCGGANWPTTHARAAPSSAP